MKLAIATDFAGTSFEPEQALNLIAEAGFTHLHWCHHWCDDFLYGKYELAKIGECLRKNKLTLLDIHGSEGREKSYDCTDEFKRKAGVELVSNRIEMLRELGGTGVLMMHIPSLCANTPKEVVPEVWARFDALRRSLDELMPLLDAADVTIAVENMWLDTWATHEKLLAEYPPERIGICYDSGHANADPSLDRIGEFKSRLQALHLHDNDGKSDLHQPPFYGVRDWTALAQLLAESSYQREISFEMSIGNTPSAIPDVPNSELPLANKRAFLKDAFDRCFRFGLMVEKIRASQSVKH